jgi:hypothetical protein
MGSRDAAPVSDDYPAPYPFTGRIEAIVIEVDGDPGIDAAGEAAIAVVTQ